MTLRHGSRDSSLPPVSVICPNVSSNALGRALLLADLLSEDTRVQVVGMQLEDRIWTPAVGSRVPVLGYPLRPGRRHYLEGVSWLRETVGDDLVIVSKPVLQSLGLSILGRVGRRGMVVDIDDWQSGFFQQEGAREGMSRSEQRWARLRSYARRGGLNGFVLTRILEAHAQRQKQRIVSNRWLQARFGGEVLYHVRDPRVLDPSLPPSVELPPLPASRTWVGFVGTPRLHKGIRVLVDAIRRARTEVPLGLVIMGATEGSDPDIAHGRATLGTEGLRVLPPFPMEALRDHLRLPDILSVPSMDVPGSWGQIPAKLFDAMSMGKPIVASAVNDIPEILDGVGLCVPPGDPDALSAALVRLARDPALGAALGAGARCRLIERYSYAAGRAVLLDVVRRAAR